MTITGTELGDEKLATLQEERWEHFGSRTFHCRKHNTSFDPAEEPCWECYEECTPNETLVKSNKYALDSIHQVPRIKEE